MGAEREELVAELETLRKSEIVRVLARKHVAKVAVLKQRSKAELVQTLADAIDEGTVKFSDL